MQKYAENYAKPTRRHVLGGGLASAALVLASHSHSAVSNPISELPPIGMGTWLTFDVGNSAPARVQRVKVLRTFLELGGRMVDSSPMYGSSEDVLGRCLTEIGDAPVYAASKVWIPSVSLGAAQMEASRELWSIPRFDLMQVHNLLSYEGHIETLRDMKASGRVGQIGVTTSHGRRHQQLAEIMTDDNTLDSVQLTYNITDRDAEDRLLPLAQERGLPIIVNRPFQRGSLIAKLNGQPLPDLASEIGVETWPQYLLKWVISHPAVTVAIPATSNIAHMRENMAAMHGPMPDAALRQHMADYVMSL